MTRFKFFVTHYLAKFLILIGISLFIGSSYQFFSAEIVFYYNEFTGKRYEIDPKQLSRNVGEIDKDFTNVVENNSYKIQPVNTEFSIIIEKLNVNAPVVKDVSVLNEKDYMEALKNGVAHASFSGYPSDKDSNVYLFAHSAYNFWELGRYSSVFNQLHKLNIKDTITIFYEGKRYVYEVDNMLIFKDFQVTDAVFQTIGPTLTLQTCYPPGTTLNRLVVRASLIGIF